MSRTFVGFTPHQKQREIIDSIINSDAKYHIANIGRQFGKSLLGQNLALYWMINNGPCKVMWVSPIYQQANKVHKELYEAIAESGIVQSNNFSSNELKLKNGSTIIFRSAERYDGIRGETLDFAILDECAFMKDDAWREAIRPTLLVRGKRVLFISTPKGRNWFYDLYQLGESPDHPNYISYKGSSYDTPYISREEIDEAKMTLPESIFKQEYLAEFLDSGGEVFSNIDRNTFETYSPPIGKVYCGIDVARSDDYTVATFMDSKGSIVEIYRNNKTEWNIMAKDILALIKKYNATVLIEVNSIGDVFYEMIKKEWQNTHPFTTTNKSKQEIIEGLIVDMNDQSVMIPSKSLYEPLYFELTIFTFEYNPKSRTIRYTHPVGAHDDTVISLALTNYCRKTHHTVGSYSYISRR